MAAVLIIGGTRGIGRALAEQRVQRGDTVYISGVDIERTKAVAEEIGREHRSTPHALAIDLSKPDEISAGLAGVGRVDHIALVGMTRDQNSLESYDIARAVSMATTKLVGYTTVLHAMRTRLARDGSVLLFGGVARRAPYPGSTTVTAVNAGVVGMVATLSRELAPARVNAIHPGLVGDSPFWAGNTPVIEAGLQRVLTRRLPTMADVVHACEFLLDNRAVAGVQLDVDGGFI